MRFLRSLVGSWLLLAFPPAAPGAEGKREVVEPWWSLRPLVSPAVPPAGLESEGEWVRSPIDAFILHKLRARGFAPAAPAGKRALIRRVTFDLTGLPPTPAAVDAFLGDESEDAFARVVDRLLASPRYGERWARHWMDVVHFAETHGHDEDAIREHAWPYRDYLIRAFNDDKPYATFVREQIAGDVLFPDDGWATVATSFLACGPWDESSQMGIQDGTSDKLIAQYLDRDDMLTTTMSTFTSTTVHCSRCHDHKFDPIPTTDYYALQAVFSGVDRVDRPVDLDPDTAKKRAGLLAEQEQLRTGSLSADRLQAPELRAEVGRWETSRGAEARAWQSLRPETVESAQGSTLEILDDRSILGSGPRPEKDTYTITAEVTGGKVLTAIQLEVLPHESLPMAGPGRQDNGNLHLSEIAVLADGQPCGIRRAFADFDQEGWGIERAIDGDEGTAWGIFPEVGKAHRAVFVFENPIAIHESRPVPLTVVLKQLHGGGHLIGRPRVSFTESSSPGLREPLAAGLVDILDTPVGDRTRSQWESLTHAYLLERNRLAITELAPPGSIYAISSDFEPKGNFRPSGTPRPVHVLERGDIDLPGPVAAPGALSCVPHLDSRFPIGEEERTEGSRRAALADWIAHHDNVLTWRSIANRIWHYHFGRGISATPNDLGTMGELPTHPELLDWLACGLREHGGSLKWLHREICLSATYRQASSPEYRSEASDLRFNNRRRLEAECVRDAVLQISGKLNLTMGGPSDRQFHASKGVHVTPVLDYLSVDPDDPANLRRSVYRFVFRTVPDPLMQALDCPDASQWTPVRSAAETPLQALAMLNSRFLVRQSEHIAARLARESADPGDQINRLCQLAYSRPPSPEERTLLSRHAAQHGLANTCRIIINSSEFVFSD